MDTTKTGGYLAALRKDAGMTQQEAGRPPGRVQQDHQQMGERRGIPRYRHSSGAGGAVRRHRRRHSGGRDGAAHRRFRRTDRWSSTSPSRGELRWRIGYAVAALCLLAAVLFRPYVWVWLLLAGAAAAVWIGWGRCGKDELRTRLLMLFPLAAALGFMVLGKCFPAHIGKRVASTTIREYDCGFRDDDNRLSVRTYRMGSDADDAGGAVPSGTAYPAAAW